jgi:hypothetical protein
VEQPRYDSKRSRGLGEPLASGFLKHPATSVAVIFLLLGSVFYWFSGALWPEELPAYARSGRQITGTALMLIFLPAYFLSTAIVVRRHSLHLVEELRPQLPDSPAAEDAAVAIRGALRRSWLPATAIGFAAGLFNAPNIYAFTESTTPSIDISISVGQMFLWLLIAQVFGLRIEAARAFRRLGEVVHFDLFQLHRLKPLARSGLVDIMVITGALLISPLQSLDAEFRWYNYGFALMVAIPGSITLLLWPLWSIHGRIRDEKEAQLSRINGWIQTANRATTPEDTLKLEMLLAHRDRVRAQRTWLLSTDVASRVFLYLIIPPLAWVGAAMVERLVDQLVGG